jgi:hypothetical protein
VTAGETGIGGQEHLVARLGEGLEGFPPTEVVLRAFDIGRACPRADVLTPEEPFRASPRTARKAAGVWSEIRLLSAADERLTPYEAYRRARQGAPPGCRPFPWEWLAADGRGREAASRAERLVTAAGAVTLVARLAPLLAPLDLADPERPSTTSLRVTARSPDAEVRRVTLFGRLDLLARERGRRVGVLVRTGAPGILHRRIAAYEALVARLQGRKLDAVLLAFPDAGRVERLPVDEELLSEAEDVVVAAVRHAAVVADARRCRRELHEVDARSGPECRYCPLGDDCPEGRAWRAQLGG